MRSSDKVIKGKGCSGLVVVDVILVEEVGFAFGDKDVTFLGVKLHAPFVSPFNIGPFEFVGDLLLS